MTSGNESMRTVMAARSRIEDDEVVLRSFVPHEYRDAFEQRGFSRSRRISRQIELALNLVIQTWVHQHLHVVLHGADVALGLGVRIDLQSPEVVPKLPAVPADPLIEDVAE